MQVLAVSFTQHYTPVADNILLYVFFHSIALACLVGLLVLAQAYLFPWVVPD